MRKAFSVKGWMGMAVLLLLIAGCGNSSTTAAPAGSKTAVLTLSSSGTLPINAKIGAVDVTVVLPAGVTIKATPYSTDSPVLVADKNVLTTTINGVLFSYATYTPVSASAAGSVNVRIASANGFLTGPFATLTCNVADSSNPAATDFSLANLQVYDLSNGAVIPGMTASYSVVFGMSNESSVTH